MSTLAVAPFPRYRWAILAAVLAGQVVASAYYGGWASLTPFLRADFSLTREQVGFLVGAGAIGSALASAPLGRIGDRIGARLMLAAGFVTMTGTGVAAALAPSFGILFGVIFVSGIGYGAINPAGIKALVPWFPRHELGTAVAFKQTGWSLGSALAAATLPVLTIAFGTWRPPIAFAGLAVGAIAVVSFVVLRDRPHGRPPAAVTSGAWRTAALRRNVVVLALAGSIYSAVQAAWVAYLVLFSQEALGLPVTVGAAFLAINQLSAVVGRIGIGVLSDHLFGGRRRELLVACGLIAAAVLLSVRFLPGSPTWLIGLVVVVFGLTGSGWPPLQLAALADEGGERSSGTTVGLAMAFSGIGVAAAPPLFGRAVDLIGSYTPAWEGTAVLAVFGALLFLALREQPIRSLPTHDGTGA